MNRVFASALGGMMVVVFSAWADTLSPEVQRFYPKAPVIWAATNALPKSMVIYQTVPTNFSSSVLSSAMAVGGFKPIDITSQNKDLVVFENRRNTVLFRSLKISSSHGSIDYFKTQTNFSDLHGVPSAEATTALAINYFVQLGGNTNQITTKAKPIRQGTVETYDKKGGQLTGQAVYSRGTTLYRELDGFQERNSSLIIDFGNEGEVNYLSMHWRTLQPGSRRQVAGSVEILNSIRSGQATIFGDMNTEETSLDKVKAYTVIKATPVYSTRDAKEFVIPSVDLEVIADMGSTNANTLYLNCPILVPDATQQ